MVKKKVAKGLQKGCKRLQKRVASKGIVKQELTSSEQDILYMLTKEFLTIKQIANRRGKTTQSIYKFIKKLKKKGYFDSIINRGCKPTPPLNIKGSKIITKLWRYHALHFVIKPYYFYPRYNKVRKELGNYSIPYRDWTIKLHPGMVEMQLKQFIDFADPDKWIATKKAEESFNRTIRELCNKFGFLVWKEGKANIKLVNHHLARNPSELANARDGEYLTAKAMDGKIWLSIDKSKGAEHEYRHPDRCLTDSEIVEPYLNDWLYNKPAVPSEMQKMIYGNAECIKTLANQPNVYTDSINALTKQINLHLDIMQRIGKGINEFNKTIENMNKTGINTQIRPKNRPKDIIGHLFDNPLELAKFKLLSKKEQNKILLGVENGKK